MKALKYKSALKALVPHLLEVEEGIACKGTSLECTTFKARKKAFLFLSGTELKIKLDASLPEAAKLAKKDPDRYQVGGHGWVTVAFSADHPPPLDVLGRWLDESYRLLAPKQLVAMLPERGSTAKTTVRKPAARR